APDPSCAQPVRCTATPYLAHPVPSVTRLLGPTSLRRNGRPAFPSFRARLTPCSANPVLFPCHVRQAAQNVAIRFTGRCHARASGGGSGSLIAPNPNVFGLPRRAVSSISSWFRIAALAVLLLPLLAACGFGSESGNDGQ